MLGSRKAIVEPVFGQIVTCQNGRRLQLRGMDGARGEWRLLTACRNLLKVFRHAGTAGLVITRLTKPMRGGPHSPGRPSVRRWPG